MMCDDDQEEVTQCHLPHFHLKVYCHSIEYGYEMNDYKLAVLTSSKNFAKSNAGIAIAFFSYL